MTEYNFFLLYYQCPGGRKDRFIYISLGDLKNILTISCISEFQYYFHFASQENVIAIFTLFSITKNAKFRNRQTNTIAFSCVFP